MKAYDLGTWRCKNCAQWVQCQKQKNPSTGKPRQGEDYGCIQFNVEPILDELPACPDCEKPDD